MITYLFTVSFSILTYLFSFFPVISFNFSEYIGSALFFIDSFSTIAPEIFDSFFMSLYWGYSIALLLVLVKIVIKIVPFIKK